MSPSFGSSTCGRSWCSTGGPLSHIRWRSCGQCQGFHHHAYRRGAWALLGRRYGYVNARRVSRDHPERRQSCADGAGVELELSTTRSWSCASPGTSRCSPTTGRTSSGSRPPPSTWQWPPSAPLMIRFESVMRERGTDFGTMFARQLWNMSFDYSFLDVFIQH